MRRAAHRVHHLLDAFEAPHTIAGDALCGIEPVTGNTTVYTGLALGGARPYTFATGSLPADGLRKAAELTVITGHCLWPEDAVRLVTTTGRRMSLLALRSCRLVDVPAIVSIEWDGPELSVYEIESCARLAGSVAALAAPACLRLPTTIAVQLPRLQYYGIVEPLLRSGKMCPELGVHLFDLIDDHRGRIVAHWERQLELRLPAGWRSWIEVSARPELDHFADRVYHALTRGRVLGVHDLPAADRCDPAIAAVLRHMRPRTVAELGVATYVAQYLRAGVGGGLAVAVENDPERRILSTARRVAAEFGSHLGGPVRMVGLYPLGRLWATRAGTATRPDLYRHTPGRWARYSASGELVDLLQLCGDLYPVRREPYPALGMAAVLESA
ncbi:hypothetical protein GCM10010412_099820 [Nonomuraea recticatena]|uniref:Uncharacterized protein n=1 Tax=Nonomuraea recticatena TaxID=46178 RepID=A0ABP6FZR5_9ACTN